MGGQRNPLFDDAALRDAAAHGHLSVASAAAGALSMSNSSCSSAALAGNGISDPCSRMSAIVAILKAPRMPKSLPFWWVTLVDLLQDGCEALTQHGLSCT